MTAAVLDRRPLPAVFWAKVDKAGECWLWTGRICNGYGYHMFWGGVEVGRRNRRAHRLVYEELIGPIPDGLHLDHLCRNRACVNPDHLEPVTPAENNARSALALRPRDHPDDCPHGHRMAGTNELWKLHGDHLYRECRECDRAACRRRLARRRAERLLSIAQGNGQEIGESGGDPGLHPHASPPGVTSPPT